MKPFIPIRSLKVMRAVLMSAALLTLLWFYRMSLMEALRLLRDPQAVTDYLRGLGVLGPMMLFVLLLAQVFLALIPGHALIVASGYIYGAPVTIAVVATSTILGSQLAFLLARKFGRPLINKLAAPATIDRWDRVAGGRGGLFFFFTFVTPIFPSDTMCYVAGLGKVSSKHFFIANVAGRLLSTIAMTLIGSYNFRPPLGFWVLFIGCLIGLAVAYGIYNKSFSRLPTKSQFAHACGNTISNAYRTILGIRYEIEGLENLPHGPKILVANHPSASNILLLPPIFQRESLVGLAEAGQFRSPIVGWILKHGGHVAVSHDRPCEAYEQARQALEAGKTLLLFPEGTLSSECTSRKAKSGAVRLSLATGAPLVPIGIHVRDSDVINLRWHSRCRKHGGRFQFRGTYSVRVGRAWLSGREDINERNQIRVHEMTRELMHRIHVLVQLAAQESSPKETECESHTLLNRIPQ